MTSNGRKKLLATLSGHATSPPPIWLMRQAGRYLPEYRALRAKASNFLELCFTPDLATEITLQPIRRFKFDCAILFADILVVPHALGQKVWFAEGEGPRLEPLRTETIATLSNAALHERLAPVYETIRRLRRELPSDVTLIGFAGAPWTVATYMLAGRGGDDGETARMFALREPQAFAALIDRLVDATGDYLVAQIDAGAEVLQLFESWAGTIPADCLNAFSVTPLRRIVERVRKHAPHVPVIVFPRGAGLSYADYAGIGAKAISVDQYTPLARLKSEVTADTVLQGNLDPLRLIAGGEALKSGVRDILKAMAGRPFVFNLGHGIRQETPLEHVAELVRLVRGADE